MSKQQSHIRSFQSKAYAFAKFWLKVIVFIALALEFLASDKPIVANYDGKLYLPAIGQELFDLGCNQRYNVIRRVDWQKHQGFKLMPLVPYSAQSLDFANNGFKSPFESQRVESWRYRHWLGTDKLGRDVLAGILTGCRISLKVAIIVGFVAGLIGLILGGFAGYFGNRTIKWSIIQIVLIILLIPVTFYAMYIFGKSTLMVTGDFTFKTILSLIGIFGISISGLWLFQKKVSPLIPSTHRKLVFIPVDQLFNMLIVLLSALPVTLILLAILGVFKSPGFNLTMLLYAGIFWIFIARIVRGEVIRVKEKNYILSARQLGLSHWKIFWRHIFPNIKDQLLVTMAMTVSSALLLEAALSYLGIGMAAGEVSWGILLNQGKSNLNAYWLSIFPGIFLIATVFSINTFAEQEKRGA